MTVLTQLLKVTTNKEHILTKFKQQELSKKNVK
jgi:hypothetical protein